MPQMQSHPSQYSIGFAIELLFLAWWTTHRRSPRQGQDPSDVATCLAREPTRNPCTRDRPMRHRTNGGADHQNSSVNQNRSHVPAMHTTGVCLRSRGVKGAEACASTESSLRAVLRSESGTKSCAYNMSVPPQQRPGTQSRVGDRSNMEGPAVLACKGRASGRFVALLSNGVDANQGTLP